MEDFLNFTSELSSDPDLWITQSSLFKMTAANKSSVFTPLASPVINKTINILLVIVVVITMVSLGCTMEVSKIKRHMLKPKGLVIAVLAQYGFMPLIAFCLIKLFQQTEMKSVVIIICGCCPGGSLSNLLSLALQGDMNLSILMTTCSTLLAFGMMPLLLYVYCWGLNLQNTVPFVELTISLVMILMPCGAGILINYLRPQYAKTVKKVGLIFISIAMVVVLILSIIGSIGSIVLAILIVLSAPLIASAAIMPFLGYSFGYTVSWLFRLSPSERRTIAMETGCQNIQLCTTILKLAFPIEVVGPLFLFPMVYMLFQMAEAGLLIVVFRCHQRFTLKGKEKYQPAIAEDDVNEDSEGTV